MSIARLKKWVFISPQQVRTLAIIAIAVLVTVAGSWIIGSTKMGMMVIFGVVGLILAALIIIRPAIGLYVLLISIYLNLSDLIAAAFDTPSINKPLVVLVFVAVLGTRMILHKKPFIHRIPELMMLVYLLVQAASSALGSFVVELPFKQILDQFKDFLIVLIIVQLAEDEQTWKNAQWVIIWSAALVAALAWFQFATNNYEFTFIGLANGLSDATDAGIGYVRASGQVTEPNYFGQVLIMVYPLALYRFLAPTARQGKLVGLILTSLILGTIILTYSRATFLSATLLTALILRERGINLFKVGFVTLALLVVLMPILPQGYIERVVSIGELKGGREQSEESFRGRYGEATVALLMFQDHPVLGIGYSLYPENYLIYSEKLGIDPRASDRQAHSFYLEIAAETGIAGIVAFTAMIGSIFGSLAWSRRQLRRINRADLIPWVNAGQFGLIGYMLTSIFLHDDFSRYFWVSVGLAISSFALTKALVEKYRRASLLEAANQPARLVSDRHETPVTEG
jgi:hypothetical protein